MITYCPFQSYFLFLHLAQSHHMKSSIVNSIIIQLISYSMEIIFTVQLYDDIKTISSSFHNFDDPSLHSKDVKVSLFSFIDCKCYCQVQILQASEAFTIQQLHQTFIFPSFDFVDFDNKLLNSVS